MKNKKKMFLIPAAICLAIAGISVAALTGGSRGLPEEMFLNQPQGLSGSGFLDHVHEYTSPIDWDSLKSVNTDIYAWLSIPGTDISYAVVQHPTDDSYYLDHTPEKDYSYEGALFTEHRYNSKDFTDPVTVIYGHNLLSGKYFGNMQSFYSDASNFNSSKQMVIYLPDKELTYEPFATVIFDDRHLLYNADYSDKNNFDYFFKTVSVSKEIGNNYDREAFPEFGDRVLILSTCLNGDRSRRYLVMGKLIGESSHIIIDNF